jgi:low temperature requirement protein LtrA
MPARTVLWGLAAVVDLATPRILRRRLTAVSFDAGHLVERFGLFVIIALGESVVDIGASAARAEPLTAAGLLAVAASFVVAAGLWWVYFVYATSAIRHALATAQIQTDIVRPVLSWGHLSFVGAIIAVAVGLTEVVTRPTADLGPGPAALLFGGTGLYLATFGYTRWRMFHTWAKTRLTTAAAVLALLPVAHVVPGLVALGILAAIVVALNVVEHAMVAHTVSAQIR